jgi:hypothetical protein
MPDPSDVLSIEELRAVLNRPQLTDEQLHQIRDDLTCFARVLIEGYLRQRRTRIPPKPL